MRFCRFRLRSVFVVTLLAGGLSCGVAWYMNTYHWRPARVRVEQERARKMVLEWGGAISSEKVGANAPCVYGVSLTGSASSMKKGDFQTPFTAREAFIKGEPREGDRLIRANGVGDPEVRQLATFPSLRMLELTQTRVSDDGLEAIGGMHELEELDLSGTTITGDGFKHLASLPGLRVLNVQRTNLTAESAQSLASFPALEELYCAGIPLSARFLRALAQSRTIRHLEISLGEGADSRDEPLEHLDVQCLAQIRTLEILDVDWMPQRTQDELTKTRPTLKINTSDRKQGGRLQP